MSNIYLHCVRVDVFATATIEVKACEMHVTASAVGGGCSRTHKALNYQGSSKQTKQHAKIRADGTLRPKEIQTRSLR
ncbi:MAG: hypothetical protein JKX81_03180 [Arenicella sp.]|nr:hypothetical protein [Arenicella sp.]